jgi:hypothetical protein
MDPDIEDQDVDTGDDLLVVEEDANTGDDVTAQADDADDAAVTDDAANDGADADAEVVIGFGEDAAAAEEEGPRAAEWVRELRKSNREKDRRIRELERKVATGTPAAQTVEAGERPTLMSCDYDEAKFETALEAWKDRKREVEDRKRAQEQAEEQMQAQWKSRITAVDKAAGELKVKNQDDAALTFADTFSPVQQGIIIGGPDDAKVSAQLRYALGMNPKKAKELAGIQDPVKFAFAVAKLESKLKVTPRKTAPPPERVIRSSVAGAAVVDNRYDALVAEAQKTGDMSKVRAYKRALKEKQRQAA